MRARNEDLTFRALIEKLGLSAEANVVVTRSFRSNRIVRSTVSCDQVFVVSVADGMTVKRALLKDGAEFDGDCPLVADRIVTRGTRIVFKVVDADG